jgi:hypothetical protein
MAARTLGSEQQGLTKLEDKRRDHPTQADSRLVRRGDTTSRLVLPGALTVSWAQARLLTAADGGLHKSWPWQVRFVTIKACEKINCPQH